MLSLSVNITKNVSVLNFFKITAKFAKKVNQWHFLVSVSQISLVPAHHITTKFFYGLHFKMCSLYLKFVYIFYSIQFRLVLRPNYFLSFASLAIFSAVRCSGLLVRSDAICLRWLASLGRAMFGHV